MIFNEAQPDVIKAAITYWWTSLTKIAEVMSIMWCGSVWAICWSIGKVHIAD